MQARTSASITHRATHAILDWTETAKGVAAGAAGGGTLVPLLGVGACAIQFGAFNAVRHLIEHYGIRTAIAKPTTDMVAVQICRCPSFISSVLRRAWPIALARALSSTSEFRIRLQTQPSLVKGIGGCILFLDLGIACGRLSGPGLRLGCMYRGQVGSLLREVHGYGVWFAAYEGLLGPSLDVVKSKMQGDGLGPEQRSRYAFRATWETVGVRGLFQGLGQPF
ncbi:hypothetical protein ASPSYDRAFT_55993 [Aspergillus sydowii CBS 593.65]|uniref:Uncharacterized protein n=1 Tax=Aspergillus sydowii CBS 593.65 TaxID=1036612 RepID=A0A1L9TLW4_9EURO|nr:uncharacterized protein ASPSYDRAFT_55993 [Aspergillus sydowii CBS 593.65]OJJ60420.1 hypothetical protein ASPSYDRAFT_55993 [Aspergillus sydowii CBS 593.65]